MTRDPSRPLLRLLLASTALTGVPVAANLAAVASLVASSAAAQSLPTGASVAYGAVGFQRSSGTLTINQSSQTAIVNYNSFSVGRNNTVNFVQPNSQAAILNRVTGSTPSTIAGHLNANGQVYLVNPNGIAITRTGVVRVGGGFVASTLGISDADFKAGRRSFRGNGSSARVSNAGTITIGRGGYAALIGGEVKNAGTIAVPMGKVGLGSGEMATLDVSGDGFLQVALPSAGTGKGALVSNSGLIQAAGGTVVLDAATARAAARQAVNISGTIDAHSISGRNGAIVLGGGSGGSVNVSGTLNVSGRRGAQGGSGGTVTATGRQIRVAGTIDATGRSGGTIKLAASDGTTVTGRVAAVGRHGKGGTIAITGLTIAFSGATVDASGASGGGTVDVGGGLHGSGPLKHAGTVTIDATSVIRADATGKRGNGGSVVVWSDETTSFKGLITARGGQEGGDGGSAEVSSHGVLDYAGATVLTAAKGSTGTLLLDPYNVTISNDANASQSGFTATGNDSVINAATLVTALGTASVTVSTSSGGTQAGNITVAAPVAWSAGTTLTLTAANAIAVNAPITVAGAGKLTLNAATTTTNVQSAQLLISFGTGGSVSFAAGQGGTGIAGQALTINNNGYTLIHTLAQLQAVNSNLGGRYALAGDIDLTGQSFTTAVISSGGSFNNAPPAFSGTLEGLGHAVSNLTITGSGVYTGLVGDSTGTLRDIAVLGGSINASFIAGGLVGDNQGTVAQSRSTVTISGNNGSSDVGGLVGYNEGSVTQSSSAGTVGGGLSVGGLVGLNYSSGRITQSTSTAAVSGRQNIGGLVGYSFGSITQSSSAGTVGGLSNVGGLAGYNRGTITQSSAGGTVTGTGAGVDNFQTLGGLVGFNAGGSIGQSYATGSVSGSGTAMYMQVGGLVGANDAAINGSYATGTVTATASGSNQEIDVGGLVGINSQGYSITQAYSTGAVGGSGAATNRAGGLVGYNLGLVTQAYSSGAVSGSATTTNNVGGLVGTDNGGTYTAAYWDTGTSGQANAAGNGAAPPGITGLTTANARTSGAYSTFDFTNTWYQTGDIRPILRSEAAPAVNGVVPVSNLHQLELLGANLAGSYELAGNIDAGETKATNAASVFGPTGFVPIGDNGNAPFTGSLNGAGYAVSGLTISQAGQSNPTGLIGFLQGGSVDSLGLVGANVAGSSSTGGLVGDNGGTLTSDTITGTITGNGPYTGGLVGFNNGGSVTLSSSAATVIGSDTVGGLVGINVNGGTISLSYASGTVTSSGNNVGGLLGRNASGGTNGNGVSDSYATGTVKGVTNVGGLIGSTQAGTVSNAYSIGAVSGTGTNIGGLVGSTSKSAALSNTYFDTTTSGLPASQGVGAGSTNGVTGETTAQLAAGLPSGFSASTWGNAGNKTTPYLLNNLGPVLLGTDGSATPTTYQPITTLAQLVAVNNNLAGNYVLGNSIDATGTPFTTGVIAGGNASGNLPTPFSGTLEGLGYAVSNLTIAGGNNSVGLVGYSTGTVRDIGVSGGTVAGANQTGGVVGYNAGTVAASYSTATVSGSSEVGGLVGVSTGTIAGSYGTGAVSGASDVGGLVGSVGAGTITGSYSTGAASGGGRVGGLAGFNNGTITQSYATGAVGSGTNANTSDMGGLVGSNNGAVTQSYATGAVSGSTLVGGLVGLNGGSVAQAYATGAVSGGTSAGGLVGLSTGTVRNAAFDTSTTGQTLGIGSDSNNQSGNIAALTTAQLQSTATTNPFGANSGFSGGAAGPQPGGQNNVYPYLTAFYPGGVQAVSGFAYTDAGATPAASGSAGAVTVSVDASGTRLGQATTGANGYYYVTLPANTAGAGTSLVAFTAPATVPGPASGYSATLASFAGPSGNTAGVNLYGGAVTVPTMATTLSAAPTLAQAQAATRAAAGTDAAALAAIAGTTGRGLVATGASFTLDAQANPTATLLVQTAAGAPLTVAAPQLIQPGASLGLLSGGALLINANIQAQGAAAVVLATSSIPVPGTGRNVLDLAFAPGAALTFTDINGNVPAGPIAGQALTINGTAYTLEYSLASLATDVAAAPNYGGTYALAVSVDGSNNGSGYTGAVVPMLSGTLEGLGHTVNTLTITGTSSDVGLIGTLQAAGTVRDIGVVGGSVGGSDSVGGLVGNNEFGIVTQAYATGAVGGSQSSGNVGGLVGFNYHGTVIQGYATGAVSGSQQVGGLVGFSNGTISQGYATGAVSGSQFVGSLAGANAGTVTLAYATGAVSGSQDVGGLVGHNFGVVTNSAFDTNTTGPGIAGIGGGAMGGVAALTTAQLQSTGTANPFGANSGFSGGAAGGENNVYPYLTSFFPGGVQAVSGFAYKDAGATPLTSPSSSTMAATTRPGLVTVAVGGASLGTVTTGANGYYYAFVPAGTLPAGTRVAAITVADPAGTMVNGLGGSGARSAATFVTASGGANQTGTAVYGGWQYEATPAGVTTLSALNTADVAAAGALLPAGIANRQINAAGDFTVDSTVTLTGTLAINAAGTLKQSAAISAGGLSFSATRATLTGSNTVATVAGSASNGIGLATTGATTVGTLTDATGAARAGLTDGTGVTLVSGGNQTLAATVAAPTVLLVADGTLANNVGAGAISATNGYTIYAQSPSNPTGVLPTDSFGGLTAVNFYNDAYGFGSGSFGAAAFATAVPAGNHFVYAYAASLTPVLTGSASKVYDGTVTAPTANLAVGPGRFANANGGTDAATLALASASYDTANAGTGKTVTAAGITLASNPDNYTLASTTAAAAVGTISQATLTYMATAASRTYGVGNPALSGTVTGFVNGETQGSATMGTLAFATQATTSSNVGSYAITGSGLTANNGNYTFVQAAGNATALTITPALLTVSGLKTYDTTANFATGQLAVAGAQNGETLTLTQGTGTAGSANAGSYAGSTLSNLAISVQGGNATASNYALPGTGTLTIGQATITVAGATGINKTYDGTTALPAGASGFTASGLYASDGGSVQVAAQSAAYAGPNAGPEPVNVAGLTISGAAAGNYVLSATSVTGSGTISPATLTYLATAASRTYGAGNPALAGTVTGFVNGETQASATMGQLAFATAATSASNVGSYAVSGSGLTANNGNYTFVQAAGNATALTITPALLTVSGLKTYDATPGFATGQLAVAGAQNGETLTLTQGTGTAASANAGSYAGSTLSNLAVSVQGGNAQASNYALPGTGTLTIGQATITVAGATGINKTYDATTALPAGASGFTTTGVIGNNATVSASSAMYAGANAGPEPVNVAGLTISGAGAGNYVLSATSVTGSGTIAPATLTYVANAATSTYGATPTGLGGTITGFVGGQTQASATMGQLAFATPANASSNVGSYAINGSGLTANNGNYTFVQAAGNATALTITPALLTVSGLKTYDTTANFATGQLAVAGAQNGETLTLTQGTGTAGSANAGSYAGSTLSNLAIQVSGGNAQASNYALPAAGTLVITPATVTVAGATGVNKTYDGTTALPAGASGFTASGFYASDGGSVQVAAQSAAYAGPNAGPEPVNVAGLTISGAAAGNYVLSATSVTGSGTISPATLTYMATAASRTYGAGNPALAGTVTGFVAGESQQSATTGTLAFATPATSASNVGSYAVNGSGLTANNGNYTFAQAAGNATALTITPALLTVSGLKTYDATPGFTTSQLAVAGGVNGEGVTLTSGTGTTASANAGSYAGSTLSNLVVSVQGGNAQAANYQLPMTGILTIGQAQVTVVGAANINKTYDGSTALPAGASGFTTSGVIGNNATVSASSAAYANANAGPEPVNVAGLTISGAGAGNYVLSATSVTGSGTISPAPVVVTANSGTAVYGNGPGNPGLSATGLVAGQSVGVLTGLASSFALTSQSSAGRYALSVTGSNGNNNYKVTGTMGGTFTISPRALTITAADESRLPGQPNPPLAYQIGGQGLVNGDALTGALATPATQASPAGLYPIVQGTLAASANYAVTYGPGTLVVGPTATSDAVALASTAERAFARDFILAEAGLPGAASLLEDEAASVGVTASQVLSGAAGSGAVGSGGANATASQIIARLSDPRFSDIVVCLNGVCLLVPQPQTASGPQGTQGIQGRQRQSPPQKTSQLESRSAR